jgi:hypothetical protein
MGIQRKSSLITLNYNRSLHHDDVHYKHNRRNQTALGTRAVGVVAGKLSCIKILYKGNIK